MNKEDKELLLKDLSARLPYGVKCVMPSFNVVGTLKVLDLNKATLRSDEGYWHSGEVINIRPYLFPLFSMTKEQITEFNSLTTSIEYDECARIVSAELPFYNEYSIVYCEDMLTVIDWLNAHHFDYRDLIKRNLAIDATGLNVY